MVNNTLLLTLMSSDNGKGFITSLATLPKFQGFADKFLGTPGVGIEDSWVKVSTKFGKVGPRLFIINMILKKEMQN